MEQHERDEWRAFAVDATYRAWYAPSMLGYLEGIAHTSLRWIGSLPKPLLVVGYASTFVLWLALAASTLQDWQQRQVVLAQQYAARTPNGALAGGVTSLGSSDGTHPKTGRTVAAWLPTSFDTAQARASFDANKDVLDEVSPFWYEVRAVTFTSGW
jgi:hypothetical protein